MQILCLLYSKWWSAKKVPTENFILVKFKNSRQASKLADYLEKSNIFVRKLENYKLNNCLRISIGSEKDLKRLCSKVKKLLRK